MSILNTGVVLMGLIIGIQGNSYLLVRLKSANENRNQGVRASAMRSGSGPNLHGMETCEPTCILYSSI